MKKTKRGKKEKQLKANKSYRNMTEIMGIMYFFIGLFVLLVIYIGYFISTQRETLINNAYNPRLEMIANANIRGTIYSKDNDILAETTVSNSGTEKRIYPYDNLFSHVVGYATNGKLGIESFANYDLITSDISVQEKADNALNGDKDQADSIITTLDVDLQQAAYDALGAYKGAIIVLEPSTGKILAMVSKPDFNPNEIESIWDDIIQDDSSTVLLNRATQGLYPPGSTFKIITALEYIRENPDTYQDYQFDCTGKITFGEDSIQCYHGSVHGSVDLIKSFAKSCNSSFSHIGAGLDHKKFASTLEDLYFNKDFPVDFSYLQSHITIQEDTSDLEMAESAIGQGATQMTPLHLAMITSAVANSGMLMKPYLIDKIVDADGNTVKQYKETNLKELMSIKETTELTKLMSEVISSGTGTKLSGQSYTVAGKTGSAEYNLVKEDSHAWFTGFAPVESPQIEVTVILEGAGSGGDYAVPIAKRVFDVYFNKNK